MQHLHDALSEFLSAHTMTATRGRVSAPELYDAFGAWATTRGIPWASWGAIGRELRDLGVSKGKYNGRMVFRGIEWRDNPQTTRLMGAPHTHRPSRLRQPVKGTREAWTPGPAEWNALRGDLAGLRADVATLTATVQMGREVKGTGRRATADCSTIQLIFTGLEPAPSGQAK